MGGMNRYEIVREVGRGAAGDVLLVKDKLMGGRPVALKRLRAEVDDLIRSSFEREFATMASLSLPGVARVFDFGLMELEGKSSEAPFFTRSFIEGTPLDVAAGAASPAARIRMVADVASVIAPLHRVGVIHGDIKPGNSIIDGQGQAFVIDFGLSRILGEKRRAGEGASGTPLFMAPELLRGAPPSVRGDIYALGITLWSVLVGAPPFGHGKGSLKARLTDALPTRPDLGSEIANAALEVALRALAPDPWERFPTMDELVLALDAIAPPVRNRSDVSGFVAPRPRGHERLLERLESDVTGILSGDGVDRQSETLLVQAPVGGGKSTVLRELKWRLQVLGHRVIEVAARGGDGLFPLLSLFQQAMLHAGEEAESLADAEEVLGRIRNGRLDELAASDALSVLFSSVSRKGPLVILFDGLDSAERKVGALLRSAIHAESGAPVVVIGSATDESAPAAAELKAGRTIRLPPLERTSVEELAGEVLGSVDPSVIEALYAHSQGVPAALIEALDALALQKTPTASDVARLDVGAAGRAIARSRLRSARPECRVFLRALAVCGGSLPLPSVEAVLYAVGESSEDAGQTVSYCEDAGVVVRVSDNVALTDGPLQRVLLEEADANGAVPLASRIAASAAYEALPTVVRAHLALASGEDDRARVVVPEAIRELSSLGANSAAVELCQALVERTDEDLRRDTLLSLAGLQDATGAHQAAADTARLVLDDPGASVEQLADAAIAGARALRAVAQFEQAIEILGRVPDDASRDARARTSRELGKIYLRLGDYEAVASAATAGLAQAPDDDPVKVELLTSLGLVASYQGDHEAALVRYQEALDLAREVGSRPEQANALTCLAVGHYHASQYSAAGELFSLSLQSAREVGDIGSMATNSVNLGAVRFHLGDPGGAAEQYERAVKLARRAGRVSTDVQARSNLARLYIYLGLYERARMEMEDALGDAETAGLKYLQAQLTGAMGDLAARTGEPETALERYDEAIARFRELGQDRDAAEAHLDAVEALLDSGLRDAVLRGGERLELARKQIDREGLEDFRARLQLLEARLRMAKGDAVGATSQLETALATARNAGDRDVEWVVLTALGSAYEMQGARFAARRYDRMAVEVLEALALRVPREYRDAFWQDPRRREARRRAELDTNGAQNASGDRASSGTSALQARAEQLLDITKRLASEHDLDRLLERITESAIELSGAERGLVLLTDASGKLEPRTVRAYETVEEQSHVSFSRSIAEAVLIDGEPIITVDASGDRRLSEYLSVHRLMLRSVACLPIRGRAGTVGVLYLEHRRRRGRFADDDIDLMFAFADQAAIALENARLMTENERRREELERVNQQLAEARQNMEELLATRTDELAEARRELDRVRRDAVDEPLRHNMVGRSTPMLRVFDTVDRVRNLSVPVVIEGESGTGKELVARAIHYGGTRAGGPFVVLSCASIPESLLESELFGYVRGAFTGADRDRMGVIMRANQGTLFLDEVGEMSLRMQVDLLRVLQEGTVLPLGSECEQRVDVRCIAASSRPLAKLVRSGHFRQDLFYRLNVVEIRVPPLRERRDDIALLCDHFLRKFAARDGKPPKRISADALSKLRRHPFSGNVRQLEHVILNAWVMVEGSTIGAQDLALDDDASLRAAVGDLDGIAKELATKASESALLASDVSYEDAQDRFMQEEKQQILEALARNGWNKVKAARSLGMARRTFYRRLRRYSIG